MKRNLIIILSLLVLMISFPFGAEAEETAEPIKVLAIGNSFSQDAVSYLWEIAHADGVDMVVGNLVVAACSLEMHWNNAQNNTAAYAYTKFADVKTSSSAVSISQALNEEDWDYVILQQVSHLAGLPETYEPYLTNLSNYVASICPDAIQLMQQTWAYEIDSTHFGFVAYNNNQTTMFNAIKSAYSTAAAAHGFRLIPSGQAMQNARSNAEFDYANGGLSLNRDGYHASYKHGRYLVGAVWYEVLSGNNIYDNNYAPVGITAKRLGILKGAAHSAVAEYSPVQELQMTSVSAKTTCFLSEKTAGLGVTVIKTDETGNVAAEIEQKNTATKQMNKAIIWGLIAFGVLVLILIVLDFLFKKN